MRPRICFLLVILAVAGFLKWIDIRAAKELPVNGVVLIGVMIPIVLVIVWLNAITSKREGISLDNLR